MIRLFSDSLRIIEPFNLEDTLYSGQSFIWRQPNDYEEYHSGVINGCLILIRKSQDGLFDFKSSSEVIECMSISDYLIRFFSLEIDVNSIFSESFRHNYPDIWSLVKPYSSVRVMRQNPFEIMVTFMCAQGIGMHLIRRQVSMIIQRYGQKIVIETKDGTLVYFSFPSPEDLATAEIDELSRCTNNNRIRAGNIIAMARSFASGKLALDCISSGECSLESLRETLCEHGGIGMKIADCIALFGLGRFDAFPIDTHVKQYLWEWFGIEAAQRTLTEKNYRFLQDEARNILGNRYAGYAGHMLFHCWRKEKKKMKAF